MRVPGGASATDPKMMAGSTSSVVSLISTGTSEWDEGGSSGMKGSLSGSASCDPTGRRGAAGARAQASAATRPLPPQPPGPEPASGRGGDHVVRCWVARPGKGAMSKASTPARSGFQRTLRFTIVSVFTLLLVATVLAVVLGAHGQSSKAMRRVSGAPAPSSDPCWTSCWGLKDRSRRTRSRSPRQRAPSWGSPC